MSGSADREKKTKKKRIKLANTKAAQTVKQIPRFFPKCTKGQRALDAIETGVLKIELWCTSNGL